MTLASGTDAIETKRLVLRRITPDDLDFYTCIQADPDVARYIATGKPRSPQESRDWLMAVLASYADAALGQLAVLRKSDGVLVGRCGLSDAVVEAAPVPGAVRKGWFFRAQAPADVQLEQVPELGYTFAKEHWGKGYASEAAGCVYNYARSALRLGKIMSVIDADNHASLAVARKFGVTFFEQIELSGHAFDRYDWPLI
ncbi:MAG: GNAT family N-acetyltransferase [Novosphingobium sp.]|uniref:GNAT family N-acetyltransferase n=1 Tax=Novosphingobium sp. TaxID=1874826 RepID=UPI0032BF1C12